ncbi:hypothetical protein [Halosolutus gelatinilyticus]|uniref:hypothetical protein n=1 Tax=Halosolutus gelatinilyticus TaxID=2931975 RepID=UPI001FF546A3|nr:hypothetical protein [Halosolutus gelatinilyticus]
MARQLEIGETVQLNHSTRRRFLRLLGAGTVSIAGLQSALGTAYGEEPEGVPLTLTKDKQGRPDKVKIIEEERYELLQAYKDFSEKVRDKDEIRSITLHQQSDSRTDLKIEITVPEPENEIRSREVKEKNKQAKQAVKNNEPERLPVEINQENIKSEGDACGYRGDDRTTLEGGLGISTIPSTTSGTLGLVCYGDGTDTDDTVLITADHVMEGNSSMYQVDSNPVGSFSSRDQSEDITSYEFNSDSGTSPDHGGVVGAAPDVTGVWTWDGILENTIRDTIDCTLSGKNSCTEDNRVIGAAAGGERAEHQVNMDSRNAQGGDSGGPWVDDDGKLVAFHSGRVYIEVGGYIIDEWDAGVAGDEALDAVNAQLGS